MYIAVADHSMLITDHITVVDQNVQITFMQYVTVVAYMIWSPIIMLD